MNGGRPRWVPTYVGIGSNLDRPAKQVDNAFGRLAELPDTTLVLRSSLYRSAPFGGVEQPDYINAVAAVLTRLEPLALLDALQAIETAAGRERGGPRWGPRVLDLDLLVYGGTTLDNPRLGLPHPGIAERNFVLLPLVEIAPDLVIPGLGRVASLSINALEPRISRVA